MNERLEALQIHQNEIVEQSSSFLEDGSLGELKVSNTSKFIPSILDHTTKSIKFKDLVSKFEANSGPESSLNFSTHKSFDELQKLNKVLKDKIIKLKEKFEGNLGKQTDNDNQYHSLYELTNSNLKRVESLQRDLQDAKLIFKSRSKSNESVHSDESECI